MRALVLAPFAPEALACLSSRLPVTYESWADTRRLADPRELAHRLQAEGYSVLVVEADFLPEELFVGAPVLRLVGVCRHSPDHVDLAAATSHGVAVVNTPGRNAPAVAELTMALMLALARRLNSLDALVRQGRWRNPVGPYLEMAGSELAGKTLGILGLGRVGRRVARLARAFDMRVLAYDPYLADSGSGLPAGAEAGDPPEPGDARLVSSLPGLLSQSDYLSIHVPATPETEGLLDRKMLAAIKPGCRLINTGSYRAVEQGALVEALRAGALAGAAFDVFDTHPIMPDSPLLALDNVVLTPHMGGATRETVARQSQMVVEDIGRFLLGLRPQHLVNPEVWGSGG